MGILDSLKSLFQKKLKVVEVDYADLCAHPQDHVRHVMAQRRTAFLIKGVLSKAEVQQMKLDLEAMPATLFEVPHPGARTFPPACSTGQLDQDSVDGFFARSQQLNDALRHHLTLDIAQRYATLLQKLNNDNAPLLATRRTDGAPYVHGTMRYIEPNTDPMGLTTPHTGWDYAHRNIKWSYAPVAKYADVYRQISVFMVVQRPDTGGDFTLFDFSREEYHNVKGLSLERKSDGKRFDIFNDPSKFKTLTLEEGDAMLFADFDRWHRVEPVIGSRPRISYGCWAAYSTDDSNLYYWS
jgi:hypothetical protein